MKFASTLAAVALVGFASAASATDISVSIGGEVAPGVYGRVDINSGRPPPVVVYPQPVLITRATPATVNMAPIYLHVPPGHAKNWSKHCREYNACGRRVLFVKSAEYEPGYRPKGKGRGDDERGPGNGRGKGHGKKGD